MARLVDAAEQQLAVAARLAVEVEGEDGLRHEARLDGVVPPRRGARDGEALEGEAEDAVEARGDEGHARLLGHLRREMWRDVGRLGAVYGDIGSSLVTW